MKSTTPWQRVDSPSFRQLKGRVSCEVLVIGGGITGLTAAFLLKKAGKKVVLLERDRVGSGDTGCTTAHLTQVTDRRLSALVSTFGRDAARLTWEGGAAAIFTIEQIAREIDAECDFRRIPAFLHAPLDSSAPWPDEFEADCRLAGELGIAATYIPSISPIERPGILFPNQARFHPLRYLAALARAVDGDGARIYDQSEVREFSENPRVVTTEGGSVECEDLVIATHVPLVGESGLIGAAALQTKLAPYTTYALGATIPRDRFPEASYWDTADPYHYLRVDRGERKDYAIFGGEDHKTGQDDEPHDRFVRLETTLKQMVPEAKVDHRWSGQVIETHDGLPYIGETAERQFVATGFAGNGMTLGTLAAMMACDALSGRRNPWQNLFAPGRTTLASVWEYARENFDYPYYLVRDRLLGPETATVDDIPRGEGRVLRVAGRRLACSRNPHGKLTKLSAVCTHLGCIVHWNSAEKTWDCPCHGSRFQATGEVLAGPAEAPLEAVEE